ncbi:MAG: SAM-dependent methyltransferase [Crocinitomicaceae bacterium]|nr:SAM-dependent methyltransferase [Crocinitomicaceae bacterium]|tara:strand:- start:7891 stop:8550 length:660 start_codon:yes stop_codon:yes gene_type:complete
MSLKLTLTKDGSHTLLLEELNETYHSTHGAIQEAYHVFIKSGLALKQSKNQISILEVGFGTGLNTYITYLESQKSGPMISYYGLEKYPLGESIWKNLNYTGKLETNEEVFSKIHEAKWNAPCQLTPNFQLHKLQCDIETDTIPDQIDLIYFDAFGPNKQPKMWTEKIFKSMYNVLNINGVLVTYSSKGDVRRTMQSVGFEVEKIPGPPGKREMLRAWKM